MIHTLNDFKSQIKKVFSTIYFSFEALFYPFSILGFQDRLCLKQATMLLRVGNGKKFSRL